MISAKVRYHNLGLSDEQVSIAVRVEELAADLLDKGVPPEMINEDLLNLVRKDLRKIGKCSDLLNPTPEMFEVQK
jgi:hypothetical protein